MSGLNEIWVNYYDGAYGMTIRIDVNNKNALIRLRNFIASMAYEDSEKSFSDVGGCEMVGLESLQLKQLQVAHKNGKTIIVIGSHAKWENPFEEWIRCAGLVDGLLETEQPGHQYLNQDGIDDIIIELSYLKG